jgi:hypothetical protein
LGCAEKALRPISGISGISHQLRKGQLLAHAEQTLIRWVDPVSKASGMEPDKKYKFMVLL